VLFGLSGKDISWSVNSTMANQERSRQMQTIKPCHLAAPFQFAWQYSASWLLILSLVLIGCGGPSGPPRGKVQGTVRVDGQPVAAGTVYFENVSTGVAVGAAIEADGSYQVSTYQGEGLPAGKYQVAVSPQRIAATDENPLAGDMRPTIEVVSVEIPERYHSASTSGLEVTVAEGDNPPFDFDLQP
jgi:hypothetical protein